MFAESLILASAAGALAFTLTRWGARLLDWALPYQLAVSFGPDRRVFGFALVAAVFAAIIFGLAPALNTVRVGSLSCMRETATGPQHPRYRLSLNIVQIAIASALLVGTVLLGRTLAAIATTSPGFDPSDVVAAHIPLGRASGPPRPSSFFDTLVSRIEELPGVTAAAVAESLPLTDSQPTRSVSSGSTGADPWATSVATANEVSQCFGFMPQHSWPLSPALLARRKAPPLQRNVGPPP